VLRCWLAVNVTQASSGGATGRASEGCGSAARAAGPAHLAAQCLTRGPFPAAWPRHSLCTGNVSPALKEVECEPAGPVTFARRLTGRAYVEWRVRSSDDRSAQGGTRCRRRGRPARCLIGASPPLPPPLVCHSMVCFGGLTRSHWGAYAHSDAVVHADQSRPPAEMRKATRAEYHHECVSSHLLTHG
jgi:hypothetical protein